MNHTIDAVTLAEGLAEMRDQGDRLAERAAAYRANGGQEAAEAMNDAAAAVTELADAIDGQGDIGAALVNSTRAYRHLADVLAARNA